MRFEPNVGQFAPAVRYLARAPGYSLFLTDEGAVTVLTKDEHPHPADQPPNISQPPTPATYTQTTLRYHFEGMNASPNLQAEGRLASVSSTPTASLPPSSTATALPTTTSQPPTATASNTRQPTASSQPPTATPSSTATPLPTATATTCTLSFSDVSSDHIFAADISYLACRGIVNGYPNGNGTYRYAPEQSTTRGEFAKIVKRGFGLPSYTPTVPTFSDVPANHVFYPFIEAVAQTGVVNGYGDGTYRPSQYINRGRWRRSLSRPPGSPVTRRPYQPSAMCQPTTSPTQRWRHSTSTASSAADRVAQAAATVQRRRLAGVS